MARHLSKAPRQYKARNLGKARHLFKARQLGNAKTRHLVMASPGKAPSHCKAPRDGKAKQGT
jgi:hypothetical protein